MNLVVVPVRYPLSEHSKATLSKAIEVAEEHDADLSVLHVNLYQSDHRITRTELKRAVEQEFGPIESVRCVVRPGFLVEETIMDEVAAEEADYVVIGRKQASRWRRMIRRLVDEPNVEEYLRRELDCQIITVSP